DTPTNRKINKLFRERSRWVALALRDPAISNELREMIQSIPLVPIKKRSEFLAELCQHVKPVVLHLERAHNLNRKEIRGLILELLRGALPNIPAIQKLEDNDAFEKALRKTLPAKNGNN